MKLRLSVLIVMVAFFAASIALAAGKKQAKKSTGGEANKTAQIKTNVDQFSGVELVFVKGGCFRMGDVIGDGKPDEKPVHEVCVDDFYLGKYEVTQGEWKKVMGENPSSHNGDDRLPVDSVTWNKVQEFISRLNEKGNGVYRLPTEAEWEYAAKSGKDNKWSGTSKDKELGGYAWIDGNSSSHSQKVGEKKPNNFGIYDMSGNLYEWCSDWYDEKYYDVSPKQNPTGPSAGTRKVLRGGHFGANQEDVRTMRRYTDDLDVASGDNGFRLVKSAR